MQVMGILGPIYSYISLITSNNHYNQLINARSFYQTHSVWG